MARVLPNHQLTPTAQGLGREAVGPSAAEGRGLGDSEQRGPGARAPCRGPAGPWCRAPAASRYVCWETLRGMSRGFGSLVTYREAWQAHLACFPFGSSRPHLSRVSFLSFGTLEPT